MHKHPFIYYILSHCTIFNLCFLIIYRYYSASIIEMSGFSASQSIWLATLPAGGNFIFTIVGLLLVDRLGRRRLLIGSLVGVFLSVLLLSGSFIVSDYTSVAARPLPHSGSCDYTSCAACVGNSKCGFCGGISNSSKGLVNGTCARGNSSHSLHYIGNFTEDCQLYSDDSYFDTFDDNITNRRYYFDACPDSKYSWLSLVALFLYIMFFAPGMGPLPWTINSEIYPNWARSTAIAIATATNWIFNLFVSLTFLTFADVLGQPITFGFYAGLVLLGLIFVIFLVPETKGRSLEEMEELFKRPHFLSWFNCKANQKK